MNFKRNILLWKIAWILFQSTGILCAQQFSSTRTLLESAEQIYGTSDLISLGQVYRPINTHAKGDPYFPQNTTLAIAIGSYIFYNQNIIYNIATDELVFVTKVDTGKKILIAINSSRVDNFSFDGLCFANIQHLYPGVNENGFYEVIYQGTHSMYVKHTKKFIDTYNDATPFGFFSKQQRTCFIYNNEKLVAVKSKKDFLRFFIAHKKDIKKFLSSNRIKYSKATSQQLTDLMQFCNALLKKN